MLAQAASVRAASRAAPVTTAPGRRRRPVVVVPLRSHLAPVTALVAVVAPGLRPARRARTATSSPASPTRSPCRSTAPRPWPTARSWPLISDRERIARDLHDIVIQRLFATGLQLQGVAAMAGDGAVTDRLDKSVADLDDTIKAIRGTIFELQDRSGDSLRAAIRNLVKEYVPVLGFSPGRPHVRSGRHRRAAGPRRPAAGGAARGDLQRRPARPRRRRRGRRHRDRRPARAAGGRRRGRACRPRSPRAGCATRGAAPTTSAAPSRSHPWASAARCWSGASRWADGSRTQESPTP